MAYITSGTRLQQRNRLAMELNGSGISEEYSRAFLALGELLLETDEARAAQIASIGQAVAAIQTELRAVRAEHLEIRRMLVNLRSER